METGRQRPGLDEEVAHPVMRTVPTGAMMNSGVVSNELSTKGTGRDVMR